MHHLMPRCTANPPEITCGGHRIGADTSVFLTLVSRGDRPFTIRGARAEGEGLALIALADAGCYRVQQGAKMPGAVTNRLVFEVSAADGVYEISVPVTYLGIGDSGAP